MKHQFTSRFRIVFSLLVSMSLVTSILTLAPNASAAMHTTYTVTYNGNGNSGGSVPIDSTAYASGATVTVATTQNGLYKTGYTFGGWSYSGGMGPQVVTTFSIFSDTTLTAVWTLNATQTVYFFPNGGIGSTTTQSSNIPANLTSNPYTRTGYTFSGWNTAAGGGGTSYADGFNYNFTAVLDLYAQWTLNATYAVTYNGNGNSGGSVPIDSTAYASGATVIVQGQNTLVRAGYTFGGWSYSGGMGPQVVTTFSIFSDTTLTAVWTLNATYAVTYNGNGNSGGSVPIDSTAYASGATVTVQGQNTLVRAGYTFGGWATGGGLSPAVTYQSGQTFTISSNTTLTAVWNLNATYTVTYLGTGKTSGTPPTDLSSPYSSGVTVIVLGQNTLVKTGFTFAGWKDLDTGIILGSSFIILTSMDLEPVWTANGTTYNVYFKPNGGSPALAPIQYSNIPATLNANIFSRTGYTFINWNTAANGSGVSYTNGATYAFNAYLTLYAQWVPIINATYTVTYLGNGNSGGSVPVDNTLYMAGSSVLVLPLGSLVKSGFTFGGWTTGGGMGPSTVYQPGQSFSISGNTTLTAVWTAIAIYTITYLGNGNSSGSAPNQTTGTGLVTLRTNTGLLVKSGYTFGGWNTQANGSGAAHAVGSNYTLVADITLYALWSTESKIYTITYLGNGNSGGSAPAPTTGSGPVALATNSGGLLKTNNTFGGWNTVAGGSGTTYAVGSNYILNANIILYAIFTPITPPPPIPEIPPGEITSIVVTVVDLNGDPIVVVIGKPSKDVPVILVGGLIKITPPDDFSGKIVVPVKATDVRGVTVAKDIEVVVNPKLISNGVLTVTAPPKKIALNQIVPVQQKFTTVLPVNAIGFSLFVNDKFAISRNSNSAVIKQIVGPKDRSAVVALGNDGTQSNPSPVLLSQNPISLANINFSSDSYQLTAETRRLLNKVAVIVIKHGFTKVDLIGYVDSQGSKASWITLSNNRAKMVKKYMAGKLKGYGVVITNAGRAQTEAVGSNKSATGRALNRRVEIRVS